MKKLIKEGLMVFIRIVKLLLLPFVKNKKKTHLNYFIELSIGMFSKVSLNATFSPLWSLGTKEGIQKNHLYSCSIENRRVTHIRGYQVFFCFMPGLCLVPVYSLCLFLATLCRVRRDFLPIPRHGFLLTILSPGFYCVQRWRALFSRGETFSPLYEFTILLFKIQKLLCLTSYG